MAHGYTPSYHYILNEELDLSESRCTEFKSGAGFIKNGFRDNVGKYVCGFLNSHEDGTIMLGIDDSGTVIGYSVGRGEENYIKLQFDEAMKDIWPDVFPENYSLEFVPVYDNHENHYDKRYVIEICVQGSRVVNRDHLYECKLGVFLRRDGSLEGPLKPKKIQEWARQMFEVKMRDIQHENGSLNARIRQLESSLQNRNQMFEVKMRDIQHENGSLNARIRQLESSLQNRNQMFEAKMRDINNEKRSLNERIRELESSLQNRNQQLDETMTELRETKRLLSKKTQTKVCAIM